MKKSDATGKDIFSNFHPNTPYKIYENEYWNSDNWNLMQYGREIDWSRPFFTQLRELELEVPKPARSVIQIESSDYSNNVGYIKNCYLVFHVGYSENCLYCTYIAGSKDLVDCGDMMDSELCYGSLTSSKCYRCKYVVDCVECDEVIFSKNCLNCTHCFGCVNLRNKKYCIFNQQYSKDEYEKRVKSFGLDSYQNVQTIEQKIFEFWLQYPMRYAHSTKSENVIGEYISGSSDVKNCYFVYDAEHCKYSQYLDPSSKDCYDYSVWGRHAELIYETVQCGNEVSRLTGCMQCFPSCSDLNYSLHCGSSSFLFGCVGLRSKKCCILNKQYSESEYHALVEKIKKHMNEMPYVDAKGRKYTYGEFFPLAFSPFGYNESLAYELYPLSKEEALAQGFFWRDLEARKHVATMPASTLPDKIGLVGDGILKEVIGCAHDGKCAHNCTVAFKLIPQELAFYQKHGIPLPHLCHNCRHMERIEWRNRPKLYPRTCQCAGIQSENSVYKNTIAHTHGGEHCQNTFETAYAPDRKEIVYCDTCYKAEVI